MARAERASSSALSPSLRGVFIITVVIIIRQRRKSIIMMGCHLLHHHNHARVVEEAKKEEQRRRTERDMAGTELSPIEASLAGLGCGALWTAGTGEKLLRRTLMSPLLLPEAMEYACLAGAVTGALAATGLWQARDTARHWDAYRQIMLPFWWL